MTPQRRELVESRESSAQTDRGPDAAPKVSEREIQELRGELGEATASREATEARYQEQLRKETQASDGQDRQLASEAADLREQLKQKSNSMLQLQTDMVKDKQAIEKRCRIAEKDKGLWQEELQEMMIRAKSLSEQVHRSRNISHELRASKDASAKVQRDLEECELRLAAEKLESFKMQELRDSEAEAALEYQETLQGQGQEQGELRDALRAREEELQASWRRSIAVEEQHRSTEALLFSARSEAYTVREERARALAELEEVAAQRLASFSLSQACPTAETPSHPVAECSAGDGERTMLPASQLEATEQADLVPPEVEAVEAPVEPQPFGSASTEVGENLGVEETNVLDPGTSGTGARSVDVIERQKVQQCVSTLRQLHSELSAELPAAMRVPKQRSGGASAPAERLATRLARQLETLSQIVDGQGAGPSLGTPRLGCQAASPEGERPPPEDRLARNQRQTSLDTGSMRQELNEYRLEVERVREELMLEHNDELDDVARRHDRERQELSRQVQELQADRARVQQRCAVEAPFSEMHLRLESEVAAMKQNLASQLADLSNDCGMDAAADEDELEDLRNALADTQLELAATQEDLAVLTTVYEQQRGECLRS